MRQTWLVNVNGVSRLMGNGRRKEGEGEYKERKNRKIIDGGFDRHFHRRRYTALYIPVTGG